MPRITFTPNIQRHVPCPDLEVAGGSVRAALDSAFATNPRARGYILDESGALRKHMMVFVAGVPIHDREGLSDPVGESDEIYVAQALSGG